MKGPSIETINSNQYTSGHIFPAPRLYLSLTKKYLPEYFTYHAPADRGFNSGGNSLQFTFQVFIEMSLMRTFECVAGVLEVLHLSECLLVINHLSLDSCYFPETTSCNKEAG